MKTGKKIKLHVSKNKKYPASKGWKVFYRHKKKFYMLITSSGMKLLKFTKNGKKIVGRIKKKPNIKNTKKHLRKKKLKVMLKTHKGHWSFKFMKHPFKFTITHGIILTKNRKKIKLHVSKNKKYP